MTEQEVFDKLKQSTFDDAVIAFNNLNESHIKVFETLDKMGWDIIEFLDEYRKYNYIYPAQDTNE